MKSAKLKRVTATALFAVLAVPVRLDAQDDAAQKHQHYKLIDIGTLGGPQSAVIEFTHTLTNRGALVGTAETSTPDPNYPNFTPFVGFGDPDPFLQHGFLWQNRELTDLGALINSSGASAVNARGVTVGVSENGLIDPLTGFLAVRAVVWKDGQIIDLGTLGGGYESIGNDINNRGK